MSESKETKTIIRYFDSDDTYVFAGAPWMDSADNLRISEIYNIEDAYDFSGHDNEELFDFFEIFQDDHPDFDIELIEMTTIVKDIMDENDLFKELRQKAALRKLTEPEIKALGITNIAVYIKTKYHKA